MNIKICFTSMGCIIGGFGDGVNVFKVKNPVLIHTKGDKLGMSPILNLCEEDTLHIHKEDILFTKPYTPKKEIAQQYEANFVHKPFTLA